MMPLEQLQILWFVILGILLAGYACLDGFDLGVGILHPVHKTEPHRRMALASIGPLWDGNEVWLVTFGGALFAVFPEAYATAFSAFYIPFMMLLCGLIFRGVSLEFRGRRPSAAWKTFWDAIFFCGSLLTTFLFGVAVGNMFHGLPVDAEGNAPASLVALLNPYSIVVGILAVATFALHGAVYLFLKTEGDQRRRMHEIMWTCFGCFLLSFHITTVMTLYLHASALRHFEDKPWAWVVAFVHIISVVNIPRCFHLRRHFQAFLSSCVNIICLVCLFGLALFPNLVTSTLSPDYSLTVFNASSSEKTMNVALLVALIGMPFVLTYTVCIYWVFRGKARPGGHYG